jgi:PhnB protein
MVKTGTHSGVPNDISEVRTMKMTPYIMFSGDAEEAMAFYKDALGGEITGVMRYKDEPGDPSGHRALPDKILHGELVFGGMNMYFSDQASPLTQGDILSITLDCDSPEQQRRIWEALKVGAKSVDMELADTFWGATYGMLVDRFGVGWGLNLTKAK